MVKVFRFFIPTEAFWMNDIPNFYPGIGQGWKKVTKDESNYYILPDMLVFDSEVSARQYVGLEQLTCADPLYHSCFIWPTTQRQCGCDSRLFQAWKRWGTALCPGGP